MLDSILQEDIPEGSGSVWDIFQLNTFNKQLGLGVGAVNYILDKFSGQMNVPHMHLQAELVRALYEHMGGTDKTPIHEVQAFMFVLLNSPNFRFLEFNSMMMNAIFVDNSLRYLEELELKAPAEFIQSMYNSVANPAVINILNARHVIIVEEGLAQDTTTKFAEGVHNALTDYYEGGNATDIFSDYIKPKEEK